MRYLSSYSVTDDSSLEFGHGGVQEVYIGGDFFHWLHTCATIGYTDKDEFMLCPSTVDVIGIGKDPFLARWFAVQHSKKTAMLHEYVDCVLTKANNKPDIMRNNDVLFMPDGIFGFESGPYMHDVLDIQMSESKVGLCGYQGGVVVYQSTTYESLRDIYTLYDFLVLMCRLSGVNLFKYKKVYFCSMNLRWTCSVTLNHSIEAERFFTKMWIEARVPGRC